MVEDLVKLVKESGVLQLVLGVGGRAMYTQKGEGGGGGDRLLHGFEGGVGKR